jgi:hypothetical protein
VILQSCDCGSAENEKTYGARKTKLTAALETAGPPRSSGAKREVVSLEAVKEFVVSTNGSAAEYGQG